MKKLFICFAIATLTLMLSAQPYAYTGKPARKTARNIHPASPTDDARLNQIADDWKKAYNSKDSERLSLLYTEDAYYISSHAPGLMVEGREQIKANFQRGIETGGHIEWIRILRSRRSGKLSYTVCEYEATNRGEKVRGRTVLVLKKEGRRWKIASHVTVVPEQKKLG